MVRLRADRYLCVALSILIAVAGCGESSSHSKVGGVTATPDYVMPAEIQPAADTTSIVPIHAPRPTTAADVARTEPYRKINPPSRPLNDLGQGPGMSGDQYAYVQENQFVAVAAQPLSTFSIDVDTASYSKTRMYLLQQHQLPPADAVRIEEFINYFDYSYAPPTNDDPFAVHVEVAQCPWKQTHLLARIGLKGREQKQERPACNLVFLLDVSGSMDAPNRLGLVQKSMRMLASQLREQDRVAMVVYAGAAGLVLPPTYGDRQTEIFEAIDRLQAGGSTNGGAGIHLAYQVARNNRIEGGINRVILCTDGDFNVGVTSTGDLVRMAEAEAKEGVFLTVLGFGMGNHNDAMLEEISNKANGAYAFIDSETEARKVFVEQIDSTLVTIAKDVKIQIEFNPAAVASYRLIGYENRILAAQDFNNDRKDAGEIGAGHTVTALYELVPHGGEESADTGRIDDLKYQTKTELARNAATGEVMTVKLRYKQPDADTSRLLSLAVSASDRRFGEASSDFRFAASVAAFGMLLRRSKNAGDVNADAILEIAQSSMGDDRKGLRMEFVELVKAAKDFASGQSQTLGEHSSRPAFRHPIHSPPVSYATPNVYQVHRPDNSLEYAIWCVFTYLLFSALFGFLVVWFIYRATMRTAVEPTIQWVPAQKGTNGDCTNWR